MADQLHPADAAYQTTDAFGNAKRDRRSALKKILDRVDQGELQNVVICPYGCGPREQDRFGYCPHLIGFVDGHKFKEGAVTKIPLDEDGNPPVVDLVAKKIDEHRRRPVVGHGPLKVGDHLVRITTSLRVYRKTPEPVEPDEAADEADDFDTPIVVEPKPKAAKRRGRPPKKKSEPAAAPAEITEEATA